MKTGTTYIAEHPDQLSPERKTKIRADLLAWLTPDCDVIVRDCVPNSGALFCGKVVATWREVRPGDLAQGIIAQFRDRQLAAILRMGAK